MAIDGTFEWDQSLFGYEFADPDRRNVDDSAVAMPCFIDNAAGPLSM